MTSSNGKRVFCRSTPSIACAISGRMVVSYHLDAYKGFRHFRESLYDTGANAGRRRSKNRTSAQGNPWDRHFLRFLSGPTGSCCRFLYHERGFSYPCSSRGCRRARCSSSLDKNRGFALRLSSGFESFDFIRDELDLTFCQFRIHRQGQDLFGSLRRFRKIVLCMVQVGICLQVGKRNGIMDPRRNAFCFEMGLQIRTLFLYWS